MNRCVAVERQSTGYGRGFVLLLLIGALALTAGPVSATSIVPATARELAARADVIVHGVVVSSHVGEDALGRPETITSITPLEVLKGHVSGVLVLHQLGGELPDGRFFKLWGRPEYEAGHEVVVFAIARPEGDHQTAELVLGKFAVQHDERGVSFAVPALAADAHVQVTVMRRRQAPGPGGLEATPPGDILAPRELDGFLRSLRGNGTTPQGWAAPRGALTSSVYPEYLPQDVAPFSSTSAASGAGTTEPRPFGPWTVRPTSPAAERRRRPTPRPHGAPRHIRRSTTRSGPAATTRSIWTPCLLHAAGTRAWRAAA